MKKQQKHFVELNIEKVFDKIKGDLVNELQYLAIVLELDRTKQLIHLN